MLAWDSFFHLCQTTSAGCFRCSAHTQHRGGADVHQRSRPWGGDRSFGGEPLYHGSLDPAEYRSLLDRNGFRVVSHVVEDPDCGGHTIWLAQLI